MPEDNVDHDPYSTAVKAIADALETALDDGVSGQMSSGEHATLEAVATTLVHHDPAVEINPRVG